MVQRTVRAGLIVGGSDASEIAKLAREVRLVRISRLSGDVADAGCAAGRQSDGDLVKATDAKEFLRGQADGAAEKRNEVSRAVARTGVHTLHAPGTLSRPECVGDRPMRDQPWLQPCDKATFQDTEDREGLLGFQKLITQIYPARTPNVIEPDSKVGELVRRDAQDGASTTRPERDAKDDSRRLGALKVEAALYAVNDTHQGCRRAAVQDGESTARCRSPERDDHLHLAGRQYVLFDFLGHLPLRPPKALDELRELFARTETLNGSLHRQGGS